MKEYSAHTMEAVERVMKQQWQVQMDSFKFLI